MKPIADIILQNGRITTLDPRHPSATEVVIAGDKFAGVDNAAEFERGPQTKVIDLKGRRVIPGLYDSHLHVIRGGLNYNMELRWEGVPSLSLAPPFPPLVRLVPSHRATSLSIAASRQIFICSGVSTSGSRRSTFGSSTLIIGLRRMNSSFS
jgi:hypothetical protein